MNYKTDDHKHDRFLFEKDGVLHFGCINPFCMHGNPGLPQHWKIPKDTRDFKIGTVTHEDRTLCIVVTSKKDGPNFKAGEEITIVASDNLESCSNNFKQRFGV